MLCPLVNNDNTMIRTSAAQFEVMVAFMERNGDLSKPGEISMGRLKLIHKWNELTNALNLDPTTAKSANKWKKVWSDFKNNCKRKAFKINRDASGRLSSLEQRVLSIIRNPAASDQPFDDVSFDLDDPSKPSASPRGFLPEGAGSPPWIHQDVEVVNIMEDYNRPSGSNRIPFLPEVVEAVSPTPHHTQNPRRRRRQVHASWRSIRGRRRLLLSPAPSIRNRWRCRHVDAFLESDEHWRNLATEFVTRHMKMREEELRQQSQWQTLFAKLTEVLDKHLNK